jgi:hypothetical protein
MHHLRSGAVDTICQRFGHNVFGYRTMS